MAGAASLGLPNLPLLGELAVFGAEPVATMRFGPNLEPVMRLIDETPRDKCVAVFSDQLWRGLPYRGSWRPSNSLASVRRHRSLHDVFRDPFRPPGEYGRARRSGSFPCSGRRKVTRNNRRIFPGRCSSAAPRDFPFANAIVSLAFSPDDTRLVAVYGNGMIRIWDATPLPAKGR